MLPRSRAHVGSLLLAAALAALLLLACASEQPQPPADIEELRDRVWTALRGDQDQVLHLQLSIPSVDGGFELSRETWVEWSTDSIREANYTNPDEPPLTLIVGDRQYYPPAAGSYLLPLTVGGRTFEPIEVLSFPLLLLRLTDSTATLTEVETDGAPTWRLEQAGVQAEGIGEQSFCADVSLDFDALSYLLRSVAAADCGAPSLARFPIAAELLDRTALSSGFFSPDDIRGEILSPEIASLRSGSFTAYWLGSAYGDLLLDGVSARLDGAWLHYSPDRSPDAPITGRVVELFIAPATSPVGWSCDSLPSTDPAAPRLEVVQSSFGTVEACVVSGEIIELRLTIDQTSLLITGSGSPRPDLLKVAESLQPLESAP